MWASFHQSICVRTSLTNFPCLNESHQSQREKWVSSKDHPYRPSMILSQFQTWLSRSQSWSQPWIQADFSSRWFLSRGLPSLIGVFQPLYAKSWLLSISPSEFWYDDLLMSVSTWSSSLFLRTTVLSLLFSYLLDNTLLISNLLLFSDPPSIGWPEFSTFLSRYLTNSNR